MTFQNTFSAGTAILFALLLSGCATGQGGNNTTGQVISAVLMGIGQGLSGL